VLLGAAALRCCVFALPGRFAAQARLSGREDLFHWINRQDTVTQAAAYDKSRRAGNGVFLLPHRLSF